jgi:hypothetical protein
MLWEVGVVASPVPLTADRTLHGLEMRMAWHLSKCGGAHFSKGSPAQTLMCRTPETSWHAPSVEFPERGNVTWAPYFCDVSLRPGWFYHPEEDGAIKTLAELIDIYFNSVGHNCVLQLNVPPNTAGQLAPGDVARVLEFGAWLEAAFQNDLLLFATATASSSLCGTTPSNAVDGTNATYWAPDVSDRLPWLQIDMGSPQPVNVISVQEFIANGQVISNYSVQTQLVGQSSWIVYVVFCETKIACALMTRLMGPFRRLASGTTVGQRKLHRLSEPVFTQFVRIVIAQTVGNVAPEIMELSAYLADFPS